MVSMTAIGQPVDTASCSLSGNSLSNTSWISFTATLNSSSKVHCHRHPPLEGMKTSDRAAMSRFKHLVKRFRFFGPNKTPQNQKTGLLKDTRRLSQHCPIVIREGNTVKQPSPITRSADLSGTGIFCQHTCLTEEEFRKCGLHTDAIISAL